MHTNMRDTSWLHTKLRCWLHILTFAMVVMQVVSYEHISGDTYIPHDYHVTCSEAGMLFEYHNSTATHIINLLQKDAWYSEMMLRYETRNHSTINQCGQHIEGQFYTINLTYANCGDAITVEEYNTTLVRRAMVEVQPFGDADLTMIREVNFTRYFLICTYSRLYNISNNYNVSGISSTIETIGVSRTADFQLNMDLYETASFDTKATPPMQVTLNEPIYVSLEKMINDTDLKMVVNDCWASDQPLGNPMNAYTFLHQGCGLDPTYQTLEDSTNRFRFQINTFVFFQLKEVVYLHCSIYICKNNSTAGECQNGCAAQRRRKREIRKERWRKRRAVTTTAESEKEAEQNKMGIAVSTRILYKRKPKCSSLKCPKYSTCVENYPAFCRCKNGFVMHIEKRVCVASNLVEFRLPMRLGWIGQYENTNSREFLRLALLYEQKMLNYYVERKNIKGIKGLKIESVSQTSSLISFRIVMHLQDNSTAIVNTVTNQLQTLIITKQDELFNEMHVRPGYHYIEFTTYKVATAIQLEEMDKVNLESTIRMLIVGVGVALLAIIVFTIYKIRNKRQIVVKVADDKSKIAAAVNNGFVCEP